jgi:hypothetical protein
MVICPSQSYFLMGTVKFSAHCTENKGISDITTQQQAVGSQDHIHILRLSECTYTHTMWDHLMDISTFDQLIRRRVPLHNITRFWLYLMIPK